MENKITVLSENNNGQFFRFQVFQGDLTIRLTKTKSVGMAYLKEGQNTITLRLWTLVNEKFYILPSKTDSTKYLVMTREPNKNPSNKNKYFWNIVGNGEANSLLGVITLHFDLFDKPIYMNIHPESSAYSAKLPEPVFDDLAAA